MNLKFDIFFELSFHRFDERFPKYTHFTPRTPPFFCVFHLLSFFLLQTKSKPFHRAESWMLMLTELEFRANSLTTIDQMTRKQNLSCGRSGSYHCDVLLPVTNQNTFRCLVSPAATLAEAQPVQRFDSPLNTTLTLSWSSLCPRPLTLWLCVYVRSWDVSVQNT